MSREVLRLPRRGGRAVPGGGTGALPPDGWRPAPGGGTEALPPDGGQPAPGGRIGGLPPGAGPRLSGVGSAGGGDVGWLRPEDHAAAAALLRDRSGARAVLFTGAPAPDAGLEPHDPAAGRVAGTPPGGDPAGAGRAGGGTAFGDCDVVTTAALAPTVSYEPRDQVVTVGAGLPLPELRELLAAEGQWIPTAVPRPGGPTTVGGLVAAAPSTPFDHAYGPLKRQLLACRVAAHDGRLFRWGRPVVKNVAGYDIQKLCCGSHGRLGLLLEASFRVWPRPPVARAFRIGAAGDGERALEAVTRIPAADWFAPDAARWRSGEGLRLLLAGTAESVSARDRRLRRWAAGAGLDAAVEEGGLETMAAMPAADTRRADRAIVRLSAVPTELPALVRAVAETAAEAGAVLEAHPLQGVLLCDYRRGTAPGARAARLLERAEAAGARAKVERGGAAEHEAVAARRAAAPVELEEGVLAALGGQPRDWRSDHV